MKNILHVSDLHVSHLPNKGLSEHRLKQLLVYFLSDVSKFGQIDTIFVTGDITYTGSADEYDIFLRSFLNPLLEELKLDYSRVFVAPGNHDSSRSAWRATEKSSRADIISKIDQKKIEEILKEIISEGVCNRLSNYLDFKNKIDSTNPKKVITENPIYSVYDIDGVGVGSVNTAWLAYENDRERLVVGEYQIKEILKSLAFAKQRVLIFHHPADWLHPDDRKVVSEIIHRSKIGCVFYGHMHEFNVIKESHFSDNSILKLQAGKLDISENDGFGGYSILKLAENNKLENGKIIFRKFDHDVDNFKAWLDRVENGEVDYSLESSAPFNTSAFASVCNSKIVDVEYDLICNIGLDGSNKKKLSDIFIFPALEADEDNLAKGALVKKRGTKNKSPLQLTDFKNSENSCVILGAENSGKTTFARRLLIDYLNEMAHENLDDFVYYLDLKKSNLNSVNQIKNQLISFYTDDDNAAIFSQRIEKKLKDTGAVIIFDSIEALDKNSLRILDKFIRAHHKAKYFLFGQSTAKAELDSELNRISVDHPELKFQFFNIKTIKRSQIRALFDKWSLNEPKNQDKVVKNALRIVAGAGMPNNPFVYTMLLSIAERKVAHQKSYMHEADLVENFIETILEKHVVTVSENAPQYKDLLLFMGYVADKMHESKIYSASKIEVTQYAIDFNRFIYQQFDTNLYINPIVQSGIFRLENERYVFSQICFFNYVYANWLVKNLDDYEQLDKDLDFVFFDKVIEYFSALRKNDVLLLDYLRQKVESAWQCLKEEEGFGDITDAETELSKAVGHDLIDLIDESMIESSLTGNYPTANDVDNKLDESSPLCEVGTREIKVSNNETFHPSFYFFQVLSLYSRVYRAAEHILDPEAVSGHFKNILNYYMLGLAYSIRSFDNRSRGELLKLIKNELNFDKLDEPNKKTTLEEIDAFVNFLISALPDFIVSMMSSDFFNQRQKLKIETFRSSEPSNLTKMLLTYCLCELEGVNTVKELKSLSYAKPYESSSLFMKILRVNNFDFSLTENEKKELDDYAKKIFKSRRNNKEIKNFSTLATKLGGHPSSPI